MNRSGAPSSVRTFEVIYLDYNATTPLCAPAREAMLPYLDQHFGNPSSIHARGTRSAGGDRRRARSARRLLGAKPHELIFTGSGTEANNLAVLGLARANAQSRPPSHLRQHGTSRGAALRSSTCKRHEGFDVTFLRVDRGGLIDPEELRASHSRDDTTLVSIMSANNETGVIQPMREISEVCRARNVLLHSDMVQAFGKAADRSLALSMRRVLPPTNSTDRRAPDCSILRAGLPIQSIGFGGAHENQRRPGTENVPAIAGMAAAAEWALD